MIPKNCYMNRLSTSTMGIGEVTAVDITATSAFENSKTSFYNTTNVVNVRNSTLIASGIHYVAYYNNRTILLSFYFSL